MKFRKRVLVGVALCTVCLATCLAACTGDDTVEVVTPTQAATAEVVVTPEVTPEPAPEVTPEPIPEPEPMPEGTVYMLAYQEFDTYAVPVTNPDAVGNEECEVLLRELLAGVEELTNWDLDVAEIYMGKGGVTVTFGENSALVIGPTEEQVDAFFVFDQYGLIELALGSIEKTVQMALTGEGGDPDALEVYFSTHDDQPLGFVEEGVIVPIDQPYDGFVTVEFAG